MKKIGLIVNPIAGMGGSVGLKGTDGDIFKEALKLGAEPVTPERTRNLFRHVEKNKYIDLIVAPDKMGAKYIKGTDISYKLVGNIPEKTSAEDTKRIAQKMVDKEIDLLVFVGGDGTARDIYDAIGLKIPVVGVPSGVKIFSPVFAVSARAASKMVDAYVEGTDTIEKEVLDIDEDAFRNNRLASKLYGYLRVPKVNKLLQQGKESSNRDKSSRKIKSEIAEYIVKNMKNDYLYLLGPGTTLKAISNKIGIPKTLLGVDAIFNKEIIGSDLNEQDILGLLEKYEKAKIIVTPIGGNGFIFGRGSKQFTPQVLKSIDKENIIIVGTSNKIKKLDCLRADTGDQKVDNLLSGNIKVIVSGKEESIMEVRV
ncbi:MAG TPA: ATP-NAD kinase family protein [bacterium]|nr:ATP-NAD kinase family protein [bacterium]